MLDLHELNLEVADFAHAIGLLVRRVRASSRVSDISLTQSSLMARLDRSGPATISDLARSEGMKPQSMGAVVASLEEMGLVERKQHATDGRQIIIALTEYGASMRKSAVDAKRAWLAQAVSQLDDTDRKTLFKAGEIMSRLAKL